MDVSLKLYVDTDYISLGGYALYAVSWTGVTCYGFRWIDGDCDQQHISTLNYTWELWWQSD